MDGAQKDVDDCGFCELTVPFVNELLDVKNRKRIANGRTQFVSLFKEVLNCSRSTITLNDEILVRSGDSLDDHIVAFVDEAGRPNPAN